LKVDHLSRITSPIASSTSATVPPIVVKFQNMEDRNSTLILPMLNSLNASWQSTFHW